MARPYKLTEQQRIDICKKYQEGFSTTELSKIHSIAIASVRKLLLKNYIPIRSRQESRKEERFLNKVSGENAWNWKGGTVKLKNKIRKLPEYSIWRTKIYERDNYTCQNCGAKRSKGHKVILNCDHIIPLSKIVEDNNISSVDEAGSWQEIWDINNGRTLCYDCHLETETWGFNFEHHKRAVEQIDSTGNVIAKFTSIKECSDELNIHRSSINRVCTGEYKTAGGLIFRYA
jgi:hypothetical protein